MHEAKFACLNCPASSYDRNLTSSQILVRRSSRPLCKGDEESVGAQRDHHRVKLFFPPDQVGNFLRRRNTMTRRTPLSASRISALRDLPYPEKALMASSSTAIGRKRTTSNNIARPCSRFLGPKSYFPSCIERRRRALHWWV